MLLPEHRHPSRNSKCSLSGMAKVIIKEFQNILSDRVIYTINTLQDEGHELHINGTVRRFRGTIGYASGDYPGSQLLGGFKEGCQAYRKCRHCLGIDDDIKSKVIIF